MTSNADKIPGISIEVEDLIRLRGHLSGLTLKRIKRRASYRSGARDTRARGRGMEYEESRAYVPGDDVRTMDWRVMARTGEAHTKIFAEEKERRFLLAVDLSASMYFGTRGGFKSWAAARVAAHLGWLASFADDRIGGLIVAPGFHQEIRPGRARSGLLGVFHYLAEASRLGQTGDRHESRLNFLLRELHRVVKPGSIVALISDFIGLDDESLELLSAIARHNDVNACWIHDEIETEIWPRGHYQVLIGQRKIGFDLQARTKDCWLARYQQEHRLKIETMCSRFNIPLLAVSCNRDITRQLMHQLKI